MAGQQLALATDVRTNLFQRALALLDDFQSGLEDFQLGGLASGNDSSGVGGARTSSAQLALIPAGKGVADAGQSPGGDTVEEALSTFVVGRSASTRRAVDTVAHIHSEIEAILSEFEREFPPEPIEAWKSRWEQSSSGAAGLALPSEDVLRMAAATTAAAARFRVRAAEAAQGALQMYDAAAKQAAAAAQATTRALELQTAAEQHSASGNLAQALDAIRQANRLRDESVEAARNSRQLHQEYLRLRREAQEAHAQADAAMRHAYRLERDALQTSSEAAARELATWRDRYGALGRQLDGLRGQAASWDNEAEAALAAAKQAQQQSELETAAGNYDLGKALMEEAISAQEHAGYARAQSAAARETVQRLLPDYRSAEERLAVVEQQVQQLAQRQDQLQQAVALQRQSRLQEETSGLTALRATAESAMALHDELAAVYEERLQQDQRLHDELLRQGRTAEADALLVHISTWRELLDVARQNRETSRSEAAAIQARLQLLNGQEISPSVPDAELVAAAGHGSGDRPGGEQEGSRAAAEGFDVLKGAADRTARAARAAALITEQLVVKAPPPPPLPAPDVSEAGQAPATDALLQQTETHHQRVARLSQQLQLQRRRLGDELQSASGDGASSSDGAQVDTEALLDSVAVSHVVGVMEATRLLQAWKQRVEKAAVGAEECRRSWKELESTAGQHADEAVRLEERALALEQAGRPEEAAATMAQADELHRRAEKLRLEADRAKAALGMHEKTSVDSKEQSRLLMQGLHDVEHAAGWLEAQLQQQRQQQQGLREGDGKGPLGEDGGRRQQQGEESALRWALGGAAGVEPQSVERGLAEASGQRPLPELPEGHRGPFAAGSGIINVGQQLSSGAALDHGSTGGDAYPRLAFPASSSFRRTTDGVSTNPSQQFSVVMMASPTMLSRESSESRSSVDAAPSLAAGGNATRVTLAMGLGTIGGSTANAEPAAEPWTRQGPSGGQLDTEMSSASLQLDLAPSSSTVGLDLGLGWGSAGGGGPAAGAEQQQQGDREASDAELSAQSAQHLSALAAELQGHVSSALMAQPEVRWEGYSVLSGALGASTPDEQVLASAASGCAALQSHAQEAASVAEGQLHRDQDRATRCRNIAAAVEAVGPAAWVAEAAGRAASRCDAASSSALLMVEALHLHADCQGALDAAANACRRCVIALRTAQQDAREAAAAASTASAQAQDTVGVEAELQQQVGAAEAQVAQFEQQGGTAQALTARFELQRLRNKLAEAQEHTAQLRAASDMAQHRVEMMRTKDSEATGNLQRAQRACELLCDAGQRASQAVQLALEAYGPAEEAVAAGARADLELLQAGGSLPGWPQSAVEELLSQSASTGQRAKQLLAEARQLRDEAEAAVRAPIARPPQPAFGRHLLAEPDDAYTSGQQVPTLPLDAPVPPRDRTPAPSGPMSVMGAAALLSASTQGDQSQVRPSFASWASTQGTGAPSLLSGNPAGIPAEGHRLSSPEPPVPDIPQLTSSRFMQPIQRLEAAIEQLQRSRQHELDQLRSSAQEPGGAGTPEQDLRALQQTLTGQRHAAESQLDVLKAKQAQLRDASPAEVQATQDRLQTHEHHVSMLQLALAACEQLTAGREALQATRLQQRSVELEGPHHERVAAASSALVEECRRAEEELERELLTAGASNQDLAGPLRQELEGVKGRREHWASVAQQAQEDAAASKAQQRQLAERGAGEELLVQLREEWLHEARQAADMAATVKSWEQRVEEVRKGQPKQTPAAITEQADQAAFAAARAESLASSAEEHRQEAVELSRQAADQRDDMQRLAAAGKQLEADAARAMADNLQEQADGLAEQAHHMERESVRLRNEARELQQASGSGRALAIAQAEILDKVTSAHRTAAAALQWRRAAAVKLQEAAQGQSQALQHQGALADSEQELARAEAKVLAGPGGTGGALKPSDLASHMILVARAKQHASSLRSAVNTAQQQLEADRDAAASAAREAAKVEDDLEGMEAALRELEGRVATGKVLAPDNFALGSERPTSRGTDLQSNISFGSRLAQQSSADISSPDQSRRLLAAPSMRQPDSPRAKSPLQRSSSARPLRPRSTGSAAASLEGLGQTLQKNPPPRLVLADSGSANPAPGGGATRFQPPGPAGDSGGPPRVMLNRSPRAQTVDGSVRLATFGVALPQRQQQQPLATMDGPHSPRGSASGATSHPLAPLSPRGHPAGSMPTPRAKLPSQRSFVGQQALRTQAYAPDPPSPSAAGYTQGAGAMSPSRVALSRNASRRLALTRESSYLSSDADEVESQQHSQAPPQGSLLHPAAFLRLPSMPRQHSVPLAVRVSGSGGPGERDSYVPTIQDHGDLPAPTAGALLDQVAGKQLRPLSNVKLASPPRGASKAAILNGLADGTLHHSGAEGRPSSAGGSSQYGADDTGEQADQQLTSSLVYGAEMEVDVGPDVEEEHHDDEAAEPDTKMYRSVRQRLEELESRIIVLRHQGDTANMAAEILVRKHEQLRADHEAELDQLQQQQQQQLQAGQHRSVTGSGEGGFELGPQHLQQVAMMEHHDAMIHLKEAEGSLCHKQADLLEEEATACRDALHYAAVDARMRRELQRLERRQDSLASRAQVLVLRARACEAEAVDAAESTALAEAKARRDAPGYNVTLEQQHLERFAQERRRRCEAAKLQAAKQRAEAARLAGLAKEVAAERLYADKKSTCNKSLYRAALDIADAWEQSAKVAAQAQHYRLLALKHHADMLAARLKQQQQEQHHSGGRDFDSSLTSRVGSTTGTFIIKQIASSVAVPSRSLQASAEVLQSLAKLADAAADSISSCLDEITGSGSDAIRAVRIRAQQLARLMQLYDSAHAVGDDLTTVSAQQPRNHEQQQDHQQQQQQPGQGTASSESGKRLGRIAALEALVAELELAGARAGELRRMCVEAAAAHAALCDMRSEPGTMQAQLMGHRDALLMPEDKEQVDKLQRQLTAVEVQVPLARDQLGVALQAVEYAQAASQLTEAYRDLNASAAAAGDAAEQLEGLVAVRQEELGRLRGHLLGVQQEAHLLRAGGSNMQAAAADEAARRLAKDTLSADGQLEALVQEVQLKRSEQALSSKAAADMQQVAEGSSELALLLHRMVVQQHQAREASRRAQELSHERDRALEEAKARQHMADEASRHAEALQHQSLQCRMELEFATADARRADAEQARAEANEHRTAAAAARHVAQSTSQQLAAAVQHRDLVLREVRLLHQAAGHLQEALSCMRDKHHLERRLRDLEHERKLRGPAPASAPTEGPVEDGGAARGSKVDDVEVLRTQVAASVSTIKHHQASKASYVQAADLIHAAATSRRRVAECITQADAAMEALVKERVAAAAASDSGALALEQQLNPAGLIQVPNQVPSIAATGAFAQLSSGSTALTPNSGPSLRLLHAELHHRCLRNSLPTLEAIAAAAEQAAGSRVQQVELADQAAALVNDLADKILEAEANAEEAGKLEAAARAAGTLDEDDEEVLKTKLMVNALLQRAETNRGEAAALQGRIRELEAQEAAARAAAEEHEAELRRQQEAQRHMLDALDLTSRISDMQQQQEEWAAQLGALAAEVAQLERETSSLESKAVHMRQQLTSASHSASSEDVASLMVVAQQMGARAVQHRAQLQQPKAEYEAKRAHGERLCGDVEFALRRAENVLAASETQDLVRQAAEQVARLQEELASVSSSRAETERMLQELQQRHNELADAAGTDVSLTTSAVHSAARNAQRANALQSSIELAQQMLDIFSQREQVLQQALEAWQDARASHCAVLREQEMQLQRADWRARLERVCGELRAAAAEHEGKAAQLRGAQGALDSGAAVAGNGGGQSSVEEVRDEATAIRVAKAAAAQRALADTEVALAARAAALAEEAAAAIAQTDRATSLVATALPRLRHASTTAVSVARLQLECAGLTSQQGGELTAMHAALGAVSSLAADIQVRLQAAEQHTRAGHAAKAAAARGQAAAAQEAMQRELRDAHARRERLGQLQSQLLESMRQIQRAKAQVHVDAERATVAGRASEHAHAACELLATAAERYGSMMQLAREAAGHAQRADVTRKECIASKQAAAQLQQGGGHAGSLETVVETLEQSSTQADAESRLALAQVSQDEDRAATARLMSQAHTSLALLLCTWLLGHMEDQVACEQQLQLMRGRTAVQQRRLAAARALLRDREEEMGRLDQQIEANRVKELLLRRDGCEAQALLRQEGIELLAAQLADSAAAVVQAQQRVAALEQEAALLISLEAKEEARLGLMEQLVRLSRAAADHLAEALSAHQMHDGCVRSAAAAAVALSQLEEQQVQAEKRVQELTATCKAQQQLTAALASRSTATALPRDQDDDAGAAAGPALEQLLQAASTAQAELAVARRRLAQLEQRVAAARADSVQAEFRAQGSQLRVTTASQRAEDAQQLLGVLSALPGSSQAMEPDDPVARATSAPNSRPTATQQALGSGSTTGGEGVSGVAEAPQAASPGILAVAQLHSVTLQALAEAASRFVDSLVVSAAADEARSQAVESTRQAAAATERVRDLQQRGQQAVREEQAADVLIGVERLHYQEHTARGTGTAQPVLGVARQQGPGAEGADEGGVDGGSSAILALEVERLGHEAAYQEAMASQKRKLASCLELHHSLLRRMSDAVLDMARHGISAESGLAPDRLTAYEAATLLATCRRLARQHTAVLSLAPALEDCSRTAAAIQASVQCMARAWAARQRELGQAAEQLQLRGTAGLGQQTVTPRGPLNDLGLSSGKAAGTSKAFGAPDLADTTRTVDGGSVRAWEDGGVGGEDDEELLLQQAQELDALAGQLREECEAAGAEFEERWVEACIASPRGPARWLAAAAEVSTAGQEDDERHAAADPALGSGRKAPAGADLRGLSDLARKLWLEDRHQERDQDGDRERDQDQDREPADGGSRGSGCEGSTSGSSGGGAGSGGNAGGTVQRELWPEPLADLLGFNTGKEAPSKSPSEVVQSVRHDTAREDTAEALRQRAAELRASWQTAAAATAAAGPGASSQRAEYTLGHWSPGEDAAGAARLGGPVQGFLSGAHNSGVRPGLASSARSADVRAQRPAAVPARESSPVQVNLTGLAAYGLHQQPRSTAASAGQLPPAAQTPAPVQAQEQQQVVRPGGLSYQHSVNPHSTHHRETEPTVGAPVPRYLTQEYARSTPAADSDAAWPTRASPERIADLYGMGRAPGDRPASAIRTSGAPRTEMCLTPDSPANTDSRSVSAAGVSSFCKAAALGHAPAALSVPPATSRSVSSAMDSLPPPSLPTDSREVSSTAAPPAISATGSTAAPPTLRASTTSAYPPGGCTASSTAETTRQQQHQHSTPSHAVVRTPREASSVTATVITPGTEATSAYASHTDPTFPANTPSSPHLAPYQGHHTVPASAALRLPPDPASLLQPPADDGPATPPLPRVPLPDDLTPSDSAALGELWSLAALHCQRTQHTHEGALQTLEKRWERCQAQLQVLQTEELAARTVNRAAEAAAAAAAASRWQRHASDLQAAMRRHSSETTRLRALALRATATCERLQLLAAAAATIAARSPPRPGGGGYDGRVRGTGGVLDALVARVPRLPGSTLARSGVLQALDGLHGELAQHEAALAAAAGDAQRRSQKVFAKAAERGEKLKQMLPTGRSAHAGASAAEHTAALVKQQAYAEQAAALGRQAVELSAQGRSLRDAAARVATQCTLVEQAAEQAQQAASVGMEAQAALLRGTELILVEAMWAVLRPGTGYGVVGQRGEGVEGLVPSQVGFDELLEACLPPGVCFNAAEVELRRGEELAQRGLQLFQGCKEPLAARAGAFAAAVDQAAGLVSAQAAKQVEQRKALLAQAEAAVLCVSRANAKASSARDRRDSTAAARYGQAAERWAKQAERSRREARAAAAAAEAFTTQSQGLAGQAARIQPAVVAIDGYLDAELDAWARAALAQSLPTKTKAPHKMTTTTSKEAGKRARIDDVAQAPPAAPIVPAIPNATGNPQQFMLLMQQMMAMMMQQQQQQGTTAPHVSFGNPSAAGTSNTVYVAGPTITKKKKTLAPRNTAAPANNTAPPNRQCKMAADCGLSMEEFSSFFIGGDGDQDDRRPKRTADPNAPCTEHQEKYLNDMGILPVDIPKTYGECSALIEKHKAAYQQWRDSHGGSKPPSGRQRERLVERGIDITDNMTREEASALLEEMAELDPPTTGQRDLLRRLQVPESEWPATKTEAHACIAHQLELRKRARPGQIAWIKKEAPHIPAATLNKLTAEQASNLIQQIGRQKRKSGKGCTPAKHGPKGGGKEGEDGKDGQDPPARGTGAY